MAGRALSRHATTIVLGLLAAAATVAVFVDRGCVTTDEVERHRGRLFLAWREDDLRKVSVQRSDERYELIAESPTADDEPASWTLVRDGRSYQVDQQNVGQLLATLELGRFERRVDSSGIGRAALGLEPPTLSFEIDMGALRYALRVGGPAPSPAQSRYAEIEGSGQDRSIVVLSKELADSLDVPADALRARELVPSSASGFRRISLLHPDGTARWTLQRRDDQQGPAAYQLIEPTSVAPVRADRRAVAALQVGLAQLEAKSFLDDADEGAARQPYEWALRIDLDRAEPRTVTLQKRGPCPGPDQVALVRTAPQPVGACVIASRLHPIDVPADRLIDRYVVGADESDIVEIKLAAAHHSVEVARKGEGWHMRLPATGLADGDGVQRWLDAMIAARGELLGRTERPDPVTLGLSPPLVRGRIVSLKGDRTAPSAERVERFEMGAETDGAVHLRRLDDGAIVKLDAEQARAFEPRATTLRSTQIYDLDDEELRTLLVTAGPLQQQVTRTDPTEPWSLAEPRGRGYRPDLALLAAFGSKLVKLRAVGWVADDPEESFRLDQPWCIIEAEIAEGRAQRGSGGDAASPGELAGGAKPHIDDVPGTRQLRVRLGAETSGGYFAQHDGEPGVFVAPKGLVDLASRWWLDRNALMISTNSVRRVTLRAAAPGSALVVEKQADRWSVVDGGPQTDATALGVRDALRDLVAEGVTTVGPPRRSEGFEAPLLQIRVEHDAAAELPPVVEILVGAGDVWRNTKVFHVRRDDIDATFVVAQARMQPLIEAL